jgi:hypothetical protein
MRRYIRAVNAADLRRCKTVELANMSGTFHIAAFVCVNCQKRNPANCRIFAGSQARRCINGHINGNKACREAGEGYVEISVPFNTLDRFVGGSGPLLNRPRLGASDQASHRASSGVLMHSNAFSYLRQVTISYHFISFHTISYHFIGHFILFHTSFHRFCRGSLTPPGYNSFHSISLHFIAHFIPFHTISLVISYHFSTIPILPRGGRGSSTKSMK